MRNWQSNLLCDEFFTKVRYSSNLNSVLNEAKKDNLEEFCSLCFQNVVYLFLTLFINSLN